MRIIVSMMDGSIKKGNVEESTSVGEVMRRLKIPADCALTLAGIQLDGDRNLGEYGISHGMELEVERLSSGNRGRSMQLMDGGQTKKASSKSDIAGKGRAGTGKGTPLDKFISAARTGDLDTVKQMVAGGQAVNELCAFTSLTAMSAAAGGGHTEVLNYLIEADGDVNKSEFNQLPPIHAAAAKGSSATLKILIKSGADVNATEDMLGQTAIHAAIDRDQSGMIPILLDANASIDLATKLGVTPLAHACAKAADPCVSILLERGAGLRSEATNGVSPLGAATNKGSVSIVNMLLAAGAPVDASALYGAVHTENEEIELLLHKAGCTPHSSNQDGKTALHIAASKGSTEICAYLLDQGADVDQQDNNGVTPLMEAARGGHKGASRLLLYREANVKAVDKDGNTALHVAGWEEKPKVFEILVKVGGADPEATNNAGEKPRSPNVGEKCVVM